MCLIYFVFKLTRCLGCKLTFAFVRPTYSLICSFTLVLVNRQQPAMTQPVQAMNMSLFIKAFFLKPGSFLVSPCTVRLPTAQHSLCRVSRALHVLQIDQTEIGRAFPDRDSQKEFSHKKYCRLATKRFHCTGGLIFFIYIFVVITHKDNV